MKVFVLAILLVAACCLEGAVVKRDEGEAKTQVEAHSQQRREGRGNGTEKIIEELIHDFIDLLMEGEDEIRTAPEIKKDVEELEKDFKGVTESVKAIVTKIINVLTYIADGVEAEAAPQESEVPPQETN